MLTGASRGANASLIAAPAIRPPVGGVVSLSAERALLGQDVQPFAVKLRAAVLFVVARGDPAALPGSRQGLLAAARTHAW
jgi:hypothetical protein